MITISLDPREAAALQQLIDAGLRHSGLAVAEAAVHMNRKITEAVQKTQAQPPANVIDLPKAAS